jgi:hypothetical protein
VLLAAFALSFIDREALSLEVKSRRSTVFRAHPWRKRRVVALRVPSRSDHVASSSEDQLRTVFGGRPVR